MIKTSTPDTGQENVLILLMTLMETVSLTVTLIVGPGYRPLTRIAALRFASGMLYGVSRCAECGLSATVGRRKSTTHSSTSNVMSWCAPVTRGGQFIASTHVAATTYRHPCVDMVGGGDLAESEWLSAACMRIQHCTVRVHTNIDFQLAQESEKMSIKI